MGEAILYRMHLNLLRDQKSANIGFAAKRKRDGLKNDHLKKILFQSNACAPLIRVGVPEWAPFICYNWLRIQMRLPCPLGAVALPGRKSEVEGGPL